MYDQAPHTHQYETVAVGQTGQVLGAAGGVGDYLERIIATVAAAATSTLSIEDGNGGAIALLAANTPIGVYPIELRMRAKVDGGTLGWKVTTGAGVSAVAVGQFKS